MYVLVRGTSWGKAAEGWALPVLSVRALIREGVTPTEGWRGAAQSHHITSVTLARPGDSNTKFEWRRQSWTCERLGLSTCFFMLRWQEVPGTFLFVFLTDWLPQSGRDWQSHQLTRNGQSDLFSCLAPIDPCPLGLNGYVIMSRRQTSLRPQDPAYFGLDQSF